MYRLIPVGIFFILIAACRSKQHAAIEVALSAAGENRIQLQRVLDHYSRPRDSLKLKAAKFLIANMPYHYGFYGPEPEKYGEVFYLIDSLNYTRGSLTIADRTRLGDKMIARYGPPQPDLADRIPDVRRVTANYLINDIDLAFRSWQSAPWSKGVCFDDFCDYILPYRIRNEPLEFWRPGFYRQYTPMAAGYPHPDSPKQVFNSMIWDLNTETNFTVYFSKYYPFQQSLGQIIKGRIGGCETTSLFSTTAMRAAGLPVALDLIMHWGNTNNRHYMPRLITQGQNFPLLTNRNLPRNTWHIVDFSSEVDERRHVFVTSDMPKGLYVQWIRTIPKVYRYTYSASPDLVELNRTCSRDEIWPEFRDCDLKDVTDEYVRSSDIIIRPGAAITRHRPVYLCVFDITGWKPVAVSPIESDSVLFSRVGQNVVYLPAIYGSGEIQPVGEPFYIDTLNTMHRFTPLKEHRQELCLIRKTAFYSYTAYHSEILKGGRFEGSDSPDFRKADTLYTITGYPFYMNDVKLPKPRHFRYLRYVAPHTDIPEADNIAEVQFVDADSGSPLKGKPMGTPGTEDHGIEKAFDGDPGTYYENADQKGAWIGIDLGAENRARAGHIKFCPRNDTNCILPGEEYELFYWDGDWVSLGVRKATGDSLVYKNVPKNALLWLRDLNGGIEERIFSYDNGIQRWW